MEEKKLKTVDMHVAEKKGKVAQPQAQQRLTYEQLNDACNQLFQQNQQLLRQVKELNMMNAFRRLDYLFKVLEHQNNFSSDFVGDCAMEIKDSMTIPEDPENTGETKA